MDAPYAQTSQDSDDEKNPLLCDIVEQNIRTIVRLREEAAEKRTLQDKVSDAITSFSGRMIFVYVHVIWFGGWIALNTGRLGVRPFDRYPYGLLTMIVSLEAIFLSTFVLISQNRSSQEADRRANLDLQIGLLTEHEVTRVLQMLDAIQDKLGVVPNQDTDLRELEAETHPEDVLAEIDRVQERVLTRHRQFKKKP